MTRGQFNRRMENCAWRHIFNSARTRECQEGVIDDYFGRVGTSGQGRQALTVINHGRPDAIGTEAMHGTLRMVAIVAVIALAAYLIFFRK